MLVVSDREFVDAAQLLSNSVAKALLFLFGDKYAALSNAISTINKWFDTMNSIIPFSKVPERCGFGLQMDCQLKALEDMRILISTMGFCNRKNDSKKKLPFQIGILISIQSTLELLEEMRNSIENKYLLTSRLFFLEFVGLAEIVHTLALQLWLTELEFF